MNEVLNFYDSEENRLHSIPYGCLGPPKRKNRQAAAARQSIPATRDPAIKIFLREIWYCSTQGKGGMAKSLSRDMGFTLVELSMVLVVIGLIIGGVVVGRDLLRASELQTVLREKERYTAAVVAFTNKYNALPGDMTNATKYWGTANGGCPWPWDPAGGTCNGDGNGQICGYADYWNVLCEESLLVWQHLGMAGLIPGSYVGVFGLSYPNQAYEVTALNIPASKVGVTLGWSLMYRCLTGNSGGIYFTNLPCAHVLFFGTADTGGNQSWLGQASYAALTTREALGLDQKTDDGLPGTGTVLALPQGSPFTPHCATTDIVTTARYDLTRSGLQCSLMFDAGF